MTVRLMARANKSTQLVVRRSTLLMMSSMPNALGGEGLGAGRGGAGRRGGSGGGRICYGTERETGQEWRRERGGGGKREKALKLLIYFTHNLTNYPCNPRRCGSLWSIIEYEYLSHAPPHMSPPDTHPPLHSPRHIRTLRTQLFAIIGGCYPYRVLE